IIAHLVKENSTLRNLLNLPSYPSHISHLGQEIPGSTADNEASAQNPKQDSDLISNTSTGSEV
ncbi:hypothetical protein FO519_010327, partial [Halicephalobus sp. NKZ332]